MDGLSREYTECQRTSVECLQGGGGQVTPQAYYVIGRIVIGRIVIGRIVIGRARPAEVPNPAPRTLHQPIGGPDPPLAPQISPGGFWTPTLA
eukprot:276236-Pyramimonas_sp.AAC.1